jgi:hypothetical protein
MANTFSFLVGGMTPAYVGSNANQLAITNAAQDVGGTTFGGAAVPRSAYVESLTGIDDHLLTDIHFTGTDQKVLGDRYSSVFNGVVTAYTGISTVTSATLKRFTSRRVSTLTISWVLTTPSDVTVDIYIGGTAASKYGVLVNTVTVTSGRTSIVSAHKPLDNVYYYAIITPKTSTLNGVPFTTSAVLSVPLDDVAPNLASPSISIQSQKLVATWSTSKPCASLVEFFSNSTNSTSGGTFVSGVTVLPNTLTATIPNALVSRSFYYAVVTPAGGVPAASGTVQQPITPILQTSFSTTLSVVGSIASVETTTIAGTIGGSGITVSSGGVAKIGQTVSGRTTTNGSRPVYILCAPAIAPATGTYNVVLNDLLAGFTGSITLTGCGLLTVTSGTPVAGALITFGASAGTRIVGPTPDPNVWVVSQSQNVGAGTTFVFSGPVDTSISNKQFSLVNAEHSSNPISFPIDPIMNSVVYNSISSNSNGISPFIGVLGGFPGGSFTRTCWFNVTSFVANNFFMGPDKSPLGILSSKANSVVSNTNKDDGPTAVNNILANGIWTHIAATYDASTNQGSVYVNGIKDTSTTYTYKEITNLLGTKPFVGKDNVKYSYANFSIGGYTGSLGEFRGSLDDIRLYPIALTDDEVLSVYNSKPTVTNLQTTATTADSVSLSWTAPAGVTVTSYQIQQSTDEGSTWSDSTPSTSPSTSVTVTGLGSLVNSRIALKVAPVVGGIVGKSEIINTSTLGNAVFRLVGGNGSAVVDTVSGRTLTLVSGATLNANTSGLNTVFGIPGTLRNVITIPTNGGYVTINGDMPAGSHSFCCWYKVTRGNTLFQYSTTRSTGDGLSSQLNSHIIVNEDLPFGFGSGVGTGFLLTRAHNVMTTKVIAGGIIECDRNHGFANNDRIVFSQNYFGPLPSGSLSNFTPFIPGPGSNHYIRTTDLAPNQFILRAGDNSALNRTPTPPPGVFISGVTLSNTSAVSPSPPWIHITSVFDQIASTVTLYLNPSVGASLPIGTAPKNLVTRTYNTATGDNKTVLGAGVRSTSSADLFQIGRNSNFGTTFNGTIDDFRAYAKALSPYEISEIVAGRA